LQRFTAHLPLHVRCRRKTTRTAGDHLLSRAQPPRLRHEQEAALQTSVRGAKAMPMVLAAPHRTAAPKPQRVAIQPPRRNMRRIDLREALLKRPTLEVFFFAHDFLFLAMRPSSRPANSPYIVTTGLDV